MKQLLAAGANPHFVADNGENVVLAAAHGGNPAALELALNLAPDANFADAKGNTALHILADGNANPDLPEMLRILARHGARPDQPNAKGFTPAGIAEQSLREVKAAFQAAFPPPAEPGPAPNPAAIPS